MDLQIEEGTFSGYDGAELFFQTWTEAQPKAVILGIHGLGEHADSYKYLAQGLHGSGYQLIMSDLRGHGRSFGKRGVSTIDEYVLDVKIFHGIVKERYSSLPVFLLGHSMGGLVLLKLLIKHGNFGAPGIVVSSPLLGVAVQIPAYKKKSAGLLSKIAPNLTLSNEFTMDMLTHDKAIVEEKEHDHWRHDRISSKLFINMLESMDYVFAQSDKIERPLLMQIAGDDKLVNAARASQLFDQLSMPDKTRVIYEGYYHEIYNELWRDKPIGDLKQWLDKHL